MPRATTAACDVMPRERLVHGLLDRDDPCQLRVGLLKSVVYVSALSLWALVSGHWSAWQAARVEVEQARGVAEAAAHPVEEKVVQAIVEKTTIDQSPE